MPFLGSVHSSLGFPPRCLLHPLHHFLKVQVLLPGGIRDSPVLAQAATHLTFSGGSNDDRSQLLRISCIRLRTLSLTDPGKPPGAESCAGAGAFFCSSLGPWCKFHSFFMPEIILHPGETEAQQVQTVKQRKSREESPGALFPRPPAHHH